MADLPNVARERHKINLDATIGEVRRNGFRASIAKIEGGKQFSFQITHGNGQLVAALRVDRRKGSPRVMHASVIAGPSKASEKKADAVVQILLKHLAPEERK